MAGSRTEPLAIQPSPGGLRQVDTEVQTSAPVGGGEPGLPSTYDWLESVAIPPYKLFSPGSVLLASFLSNTLGGGMVLAWNYWVLGRRRAAWLTLTLATLVTVAYFVYAFTLPDDSRAWIGVVFLLLIATYVLARRLQGPIFEAHRRQGGKAASGCAAAGLGLLVGALTIGAIFAWLAVVGDEVQSIQFGHGQKVHYASPVTEAQALQLGKALQVHEHFDNSGPADICLEREGDLWVLSVVVQSGAWNKPETVAYYRDLRARVANDVFPGQRNELRLCDDNWTPRKTIRD